MPAESEIRALMLRSANRYATATNDSRPGREGYRFQVVAQGEQVGRLMVDLGELMLARLREELALHSTYRELYGWARRLQARGGSRLPPRERLRLAEAP